MSFQAYVDNIEEKTGKTPNEFIALALVHVIKHGQGLATSNNK